MLGRDEATNIFRINGIPRFTLRLSYESNVTQLVMIVSYDPRETDNRNFVLFYGRNIYSQRRQIKFHELCLSQRASYCVTFAEKLERILILNFC